MSRPLPSLRQLGEDAPLPVVLAWSSVGSLLAAALVLGGTHVSVPGTSVAAWWPAAGVYAGLLCLLPRRHWLLVLVLLSAATFPAHLLGGRPLWLAAVGVGISVAEVLVVARVLGAHRSRPRLANLEDLARLVLASLLGAAVAGGLGALILVAAQGDPVLTTLRTVVPSHLSALLALTPVFLAIGGQEATQARSDRRSIITQLLPAGTTLAAVAVLFGPQQHLPITFTAVPLVIWCALTLPLPRLSLVVAAAAAEATVLTAQGGGPFGVLGQLSVPTRAMMVQVYVVTLVVSALPLALTLAQRRAALAEAEAGRETYRRGLAGSLTGTLLLRLGTDGDHAAPLVIEANEPASALLGVRVVDLIGQPWTAGLGADLDLVRDALSRMQQGLISGWEREVWLETAPPHCVRVALSWVPPTAGEALVVVQLVDLTEIRNTQRALEDEREVTTRLLAATTSTAIVGLDLRGAITYANVGLERMLGHSAAGLVGRRVWDLFADEHLISANGEGPLEVLLGATRTTGEATRRDSTWLRRDGGRVTVSLATSVARRRDGAPVGYVLVAEDVTERRRAEETVAHALEHEQRAVERLEELDRARTEFVTSVSHELRTPLTSLIGFAQLIASGAAGPLTDFQQNLLARMDASGHRLLQLVENVLLAARLEDGQHSRPRQRHDLVDIALATVREVEPMAEARGVSLMTTLCPSAPIDADRDEIERVVINLLTNAVKFSPTGGVVILEVDTDDEGVRLRVVDEGPGVPESERERIFESFARSAAAMHDGVPGTGLGLAIVRSVVVSHGGTVRVDDAPGETTGGRFVVRLPHAQRGPMAQVS